MAKSKTAKITKAFAKVDVKATAKSINNFALETTEVVVDEIIEKSAQWQQVADKAIKAGLKLSANQQDLTFKALETVKGQLKGSSKRFRGLFSKN